MKIKLLILTLFCSFISWGQVTIFNETVGTCCSTTNTSIAATIFDNASLTFTGDTDTRTSTASTGYTGASGGRNVFITNTVGRFFEISNIHISRKFTVNFYTDFFIYLNGKNLEVSSKSQL